MKDTKVARGLIGNIGVKLIALIVALVVWFNASGQQELKRNYAASLTFANLPDSLTITGRIPDEVVVSVAGTRRELLFLRFKRLPMTVNIARAAPGRWTQRLSVADAVLPAGIEPGDVRIIAPLSVDLLVERLVTKRVAVAVSLTGVLDPTLLLNAAPVARPYWVSVKGAESVVTGLDRLQTQSVDLSQVKESKTVEVALVFDKAVFECTPGRVIVNVDVSPRASRVLANVPPTILMDERNLEVEVSPKTVSLTIEGPAAIIDTLTSGDISVLANVTGKPPGMYTLAPEVIVPDGVSKYTMDIDSLRVVISRSSSSQSM